MTETKLQHRITNKDTDTLTGLCAVCGWVPLKRKPKGGGTYSYMCGRKRNQERNNRPGKRANDGERLDSIRQPGSHGLTRGEARDYLAGKACEVCGTTENLTVDHCHDTGVIRGPLCQSHNLGLGHYHDSVTELMAAIDYLIRHGKDDREDAAQTLQVDRC